MKNSIKDVPRGTANCDVLQESSETGSAHIKRVTPLDTKRKEFAVAQAERLGTELAPDTNKTRERRTTAKRRDKETRPL